MELNAAPYSPSCSSTTMVDRGGGGLLRFLANGLGLGDGDLEESGPLSDDDTTRIASECERESRPTGSSCSSSASNGVEVGDVVPVIVCGGCDVERGTSDGGGDASLGPARARFQLKGDKFST